MRGGVAHSDAMLVQVDVIFNTRVEPSIYERPKHEDLLIKQGACPFKSSCSFARNRSRASCDLSIIYSDYISAVTITYYDIVSSRPSDQSRNHRKTNFGEMSSMRCFDHTSRSYDHTEI